jgi:hypothetical protein
LIPKITQRELTAFEIEFLNINTFFESSIVNVSDRIYCNNITYHSINFKTSNKKCNYIVKFNYNRYGEIQYFMEYNSIFYVVVVNYKIVKDIFSDILGRPKESIRELKNSLRNDLEISKYISKSEYRSK